MPTSEKPVSSTSDRMFKDSYSEAEAAVFLGISVSRLHMLLDEYVFNDGTPRPSDMVLQSSDLVLLRFWHRSTPNPKVLRMPRRA